MTLHLRSIEQAPKSLPIWQSMMEDLAHPPVRRVAKVLGVSERTVYRWNRAGRAPRVAMLAVFWLTRWGRSAVHTQATNDAIVACSYVNALHQQVHELQVETRRLQALASYGSANEPRIGGPL